MKLATYRDGSRDGQLVVVSRDLALAHYASGIATRLQQVLDDWNFLSPQLEDLSATLNGGKARHAFAFEPAQCMAPLPRAYQWALGPGAPGAADASPDLAPVQRASDDFLAPLEDVTLPGMSAVAGLHSGFAVVTADLPRGATPAQALERVRLVLLAHAWSLPGGVQPAGAFAPLAVTPDELGPAWRDGRVHLRIRTRRAGPGVQVEAQVGAQVGAQAGAQASPEAHEQAGGPASRAGFGAGLAALAQVRTVRAGSIVGPFFEPGDAAGEAPPWHAGQTAHSEATGADGLSVFGALAQRVVGAGEPAGQP